MSRPRPSGIGSRHLDHVWIVNRTEEVDGLYVFEDEQPARAFAARYPDSSVTEEVVMAAAAAAQFLRDTAEDEPADETPPVAVLLSAAYRVTPEPFWALAQARGKDGYDRIERAVAHGWRAVPGWGRDGWDLGSWPLVVIFHGESPAGFEIVVGPAHRAGQTEYRQRVSPPSTLIRSPWM
jgi:hypothetical protein